MTKRTLDEQIKRIKFLNGYNGNTTKMNESAILEAAPLDPAFEKEMQTALAQVMNDLPAELSDVAKTTGDKDGQIEMAADANQPAQQPQPAAQPVQPNQTQQPIAESELREALGMLAASTAIALPKITDMVGKAASALGRKVDSQKLQQFGGSIEQFAHKMHHTYQHVIDVALTPFTKNMTPEKKALVNKLVFNGIVAAFFITSLGGAAGAIGAGHAGLAAAEGGLSGVKASELLAAAKEILPQILKSTGQLA